MPYCYFVLNFIRWLNNYIVFSFGLNNILHVERHSWSYILLNLFFFPPCIMDPFSETESTPRIMQMTIFTIRRHTLAADCRKGQLWIMASNIHPPASHNSRARNYDSVLLEHYRRTDFIINEIYVFVWYIRDWKGRKNRSPLSRQMAFGFLTWPPVNKTEMEA